MTLAPSTGSPVSASVTTPQAHPVTSSAIPASSATQLTPLAFMADPQSGRLRAPQVLPLVGDVVHEDVLAQLIRRGVEDATLVDLRHLVDELLQVVVAVQHEGVDGDALLCAPLHFLQGLADRDGAGRVGEVGAASLQVRRGLPVRDHDDLAGAPLVLAQ